ncbi:MAG: hypothetical protein M0Q46_02925 [Endomicrobiales bacterium]|nr:hypothetical protein [Endomicrobiales bacterium]
MTLFEKYFGVLPSAINKNCIICPSPDAGLFTDNASSAKVQKGKFAKSIDCGFATVISTKYNLLVGDIVLLLGQTKCKNIFLFGSCASAKGQEVGTIQIVERAYSADSFLQMLNGEPAEKSFFADRVMTEKLKNEMIFAKTATCISVLSLVLEKEYVEGIKKSEISCVDMEASIVFSAAQKVGISATALFYVADPIEAQLMYELSQSEKEKLSNSCKKLSNALVSFIKNA